VTLKTLMMMMIIVIVSNFLLVAKSTVLVCYSHSLDGIWQNIDHPLYLGFFSIIRNKFLRTYNVMNKFLLNFIVMNVFLLTCSNYNIYKCYIFLAF